MRGLAGFALVFAATTWSGSAHAAVDWCRFLTVLPSSDNRFDNIAARIDQMGCTAQSQVSAHIRQWQCADAVDGEVWVSLHHVTATVGSEPDVLIIRNQNLTNLDRLRSCPGHRINASTTAFEPGSIAVQDRLSVVERFLPRVVYLLRMVGTGYMVATSSERLEGQSTIGVVEGGLFGIERQPYPTTSVEIAGVNIVQSPARQVVAALESRGARVTSRRAGDAVSDQDVELTPPLGLEGVTGVIVRSMNQHVWEVNYRVSGLEAYMEFVRLLDERYGRSSVQNASGVRRDCRDRIWQSGSVRILGEFCTSSGYSIWFINSVVQTQREAYVAHIRRIENQPQRPRRRIDPDNL